MQELQQSSNQKQQRSSLNQTIFYKVIIAIIRCSIFICGYYFRQKQFSSSYISISVAVGVFVLLELGYWYKRYEDLSSNDYDALFTMMIHIDGLLNMLGMGFTVSFESIQLSQHYFLFELGLLFNYGFTFIQIYSIFATPPPKDLTSFLAILSPVNGTLLYLCMGLYLGVLFDKLVFTSEQSFMFYGLNTIFSAYLLTRFIGSKGISYLRQAFTSE